MHLSILPLFIYFDDEIIWSPAMNYHQVDAQMSLDILNKEKLSDIDAGMTAYPYLLKKRNVQETDIYPLLSINNVSADEQSTMERMEHKTQVGIPLNVQMLKRIVNGKFDDVDVDNMDLQELFGMFMNIVRKHSLVNKSTAQRFVQDFVLKDNCNKELSLGETAHKNYQLIYKSFQKQYPIKMALIDGAHRSFSIFAKCMGLTTNSCNKFKENQEIFNLENQYVDVNITISAITEIPSNTLSCVKKITLMQKISNQILKRNEIAIEKDLKDSLLCIGEVYFNQDNRVALSKDFLHKSNVRRNVSDKFYETQVYLVEELLADGLPRKIFQNWILQVRAEENIRFQAMLNVIKDKTRRRKIITSY